jgi:hypothetical protein
LTCPQSIHNIVHKQVEKLVDGRQSRPLPSA